MKFARSTLISLQVGAYTETLEGEQDGAPNEDKSGEEHLRRLDFSESRYANLTSDSNGTRRVGRGSSAHRMPWIDDKTVEP